MSQTNGVNGSAKQHRFNPAFSKTVIDATGPKANPRMRQIMPSLINHIHDFLRENEVTVEEWTHAVNFMNRAGQMSDDRRNETQLVHDVLGIESLVDEITYTLASEAEDLPTATTILGPFWRKDAPTRNMGDSVVLNELKNADHTRVSGQVTDFTTGKPIEGAEIDIWHTAPNGLYEQQDPDQPDYNLRGRFYTGADGKYHLYCLRPTSYPIPYDGPAGDLLKMLDRHPMRPAHIHFIVSAPGYKPLVTQIFDRRDKHLADDSVFAVKDSLIVDFVPLEGDSKAQFQLEYPFKLVSYEEAKKNGMAGLSQESATGTQGGV